MNRLVSDVIAGGIRTPRERSGNFRSNVIETLRWYCSEKTPGEITSGLRGLFADAPRCSLLRCETVFGDVESERRELQSDETGPQDVIANELPYYSELSDTPLSLVQLSMNGGAFDTGYWQVRIEIAVKADSDSVWQAILGDIYGCHNSSPDCPCERLRPNDRKTPSDHEASFRDEKALGCEDMTTELVHLLRSPLAAIVTSAELVRSGNREMPTREDDELLGVILSQAERVDSLLRDFAKLMEPVITSRSDVDLIDLLRSAALYSSFVGKPSERSWLSSKEPALFINVDQEMFRRVFAFMLETLPRSITGCNAVHVHCSTGDDAASIRFEYTGDGIRPDLLRKVVLPIDSTRDGGSGLESPPVHRVVLAHGGTTAVGSSESATCVTMTIPLCA